MSEPKLYIRGDENGAISEVVYTSSGRPAGYDYTTENRDWWPRLRSRGGLEFYLRDGVVRERTPVRLHASADRVSVLGKVSIRVDGSPLDATDIVINGSDRLALPSGEELELTWAQPAAVTVAIDEVSLRAAPLLIYFEEPTE